MNKWYSTEDYRVRKVNTPQSPTQTAAMENPYSYENNPKRGSKPQTRQPMPTDSSKQTCNASQYQQKKHYISCDCEKEQPQCDCCCGCQCHNWWDNENSPWNNNRRPSENMGMGGLEVEMDTADLVVNSGAAVPFNKQIARYTPDLALVDNGRIIVTQTGIYEIVWWVATESVQMGQDTYVAFGVAVNGSVGGKGMSANAYGQVSGGGLMHIYASPYAPAYLQLINITDAQIAYGQVPLKAGLAISYTKG